MLHDPRIVEVGVVREDYDAIRGGKLLIGELDRLQDDSVHCDRGNIGVGVMDLRSPLLELGEHLEGGRLPRIANAALEVLAQLRHRGAEIRYADPYVPSTAFRTTPSTATEGT